MANSIVPLPHFVRRGTMKAALMASILIQLTLKIAFLSALPKTIDIVGRQAYNSNIIFSAKESGTKNMEDSIY